MLRASNRLSGSAFDSYLKSIKPKERTNFYNAPTGRVGTPNLTMEGNVSSFWELKQAHVHVKPMRWTVSPREPPFIAGEVSRHQQWQLILGVPSEAERAPKTTSTTLSATPLMPFLTPPHLSPRAPKNHIFSAR